MKKTFLLATVLCMSTFSFAATVSAPAPIAPRADTGTPPPDSGPIVDKSKPCTVLHCSTE